MQSNIPLDTIFHGDCQTLQKGLAIAMEDRVEWDIALHGLQIIRPFGCSCENKSGPYCFDPLSLNSGRQRYRGPRKLLPFSISLTKCLYRLKSLPTLRAVVPSLRF